MGVGGGVVFLTFFVGTLKLPHILQRPVRNIQLKEMCFYIKDF